MHLQSEGRCRGWSFWVEVELGTGGHMAEVVLGHEQLRCLPLDWLQGPWEHEVAPV